MENTTEMRGDYLAKRISNPQMNRFRSVEALRVKAGLGTTCKILDHAYDSAAKQTALGLEMARRDLGYLQAQAQKELNPGS